MDKFVRALNERKIPGDGTGDMLPIKQSTVTLFDGCRFNNTPSQMEKKFTGKGNVLFTNCTFADEDVSFRCSECNTHIAMTSDIIDKPSKYAATETEVTIPGFKGKVRKQWFRNNQDRLCEVLVLKCGDVQVRPTDPEDSGNCWFSGATWEYAHCKKCNQQVGWVNNENGKVYFVLLVAKVDYD